MKYLLSLLFGAMFLIPGWGHGQTLFNENFDGSPYLDGQTLSTTGLTAPQIHYGNIKSGSSTGTITETAGQNFSGIGSGLSLGLTSGASVNNKASVSATFGTSSGTSATSQAIAVQFAFYMTNTATSQQLSASIDEPGFTQLASVSIAGAANDQVKASFGSGASQVLASIASGNWYYLQFVMPSSPTSAAQQYTVNLFSADDSTLLGSATGTLTTTPTGTGYGLLAISNIDTAGSTTQYIDNITASVVPEPKPLALAALSLLIGVGTLAYRRALR